MANLTKKETLSGMRLYRQKVLNNRANIGQIPVGLFGGLASELLSLANKELAALDKSIAELEKEIDDDDSST